MGDLSIGVLGLGCCRLLRCSVKGFNKYALGHLFTKLQVNK